VRSALCTVITALILLLAAAVPALTDNAISESVTPGAVDEAILLPEDGSADFEDDPGSILLPDDDAEMPLDLSDDMLAEVPIDLDIPNDGLEADLLILEPIPSCPDQCASPKVVAPYWRPGKRQSNNPTPVVIIHADYTLIQHHHAYIKDNRSL